MLSAYITHPDCALHDMGNHHPECPERLGAINDHLLVKGLLDYMIPYDAPLATLDQLGRAHASNYVNELMDASPKEGLHAVDPDTNMNPHTLTAALRAAGAAVEATDLVLAGKAATAFCCVRPPGHHAERSAAMGFCFFNNVTVGMRHALDVHGLERVALIDFDVHHGNGSEDILRGDDRVLMCSIFEKGLYPFNGESAVGDNMVNVGLPIAQRQRCLPRSRHRTLAAPASTPSNPSSSTSRPASTPTAKTTWATSVWSKPTTSGSPNSSWTWPTSIARAV